MGCPVRSDARLFLSQVTSRKDRDDSRLVILNSFLESLAAQIMNYKLNWKSLGRSDSAILY